MTATLVLSSCERTTTLTSGNPSRNCTPGCDCTKLSSISVTTQVGSLRNWDIVVDGVTPYLGLATGVVESVGEVGVLVRL